jgi:hypothetical protein
VALFFLFFGHLFCLKYSNAVKIQIAEGPKTDERVSHSLPMIGEAGSPIDGRRLLLLRLGYATGK